MKRKNILAVIALVAVFAFALIGCGSKDNEPTANTAASVPEMSAGQELTLTSSTLTAATWSSPNGATVNLTATPNGYAEGQSAAFIVRLEGEEAASVPCEWNGSAYTASADLNAADGYCYYDIVRGGIDKGVGLADLCAQMGLTLADAAAAGDSANDVGMLKAAGLGCCLANGTPDAKAAADRIIGDVREDGLAELIEELWFNGPKAVPSGRELGSAWGNIESAGGR